MKHSLTTEEKTTIKTLTATGQTPHRISQQLKRSPHTVANYLKAPAVQKAVQDEKEELAQRYQDMARKTLDSISDEDLKKASLQNKAVSSGILLDKALLLRGGPQTININVLLNVLEMVRSIRDKG